MKRHNRDPTKRNDITARKVWCCEVAIYFSIGFSTVENFAMIFANFWLVPQLLMMILMTMMIE